MATQGLENDMTETPTLEGKVRIQVDAPDAEPMDDAEPPPTLPSTAPPPPPERS
jgi:hypothetical protein